MYIDKKTAKKIRKKINQANRILLSLHRGPDGDSISSNLAMKKFLEQENKDVTLITSTVVPENFDFIPETKEIDHVNYSKFDFNNFDLIILLDCASWQMVSSELKEEKVLLKEKVINIDHHQTNKQMGEINLVVPELASTAEILYYLFDLWQLEINKQLAQLLLLGVATDTGVFRYPNTSEKTFQIAADLLAKGADLDPIVFNYLRRNELEKLKFWGVVLNNLEIDKDNRFAYSFIPFNQAKEYYVDNYPREYKSGAASLFMAGVEGTEFGIVLVEEEKGKISGSLRSRTGFDVSQIAQDLGGGGHPGAAGFRLSMKFEKAREKVLEVCRQYMQRE